jgi:hypothetical protein
VIGGQEEPGWRGLHCPPARTAAPPLFDAHLGFRMRRVTQRMTFKRQGSGDSVSGPIPSWEDQSHRVNG